MKTVACVESRNSLADAYALAKSNGGRPMMHSGYCWGEAKWTPQKPHVSTEAIESLLAQNLAYVSANYTDSCRQTRPTEITIKPIFR